MQAYKQLSEVERSFRDLKVVIEMQPIHHRTKERVRVHILVTVLAFLLERAIDKKLKEARLDMSASQALKALRTTHVVDLDLGQARKRGVTGGSARARQVLTALAIIDWEPPNLPAHNLEIATQ